MKHLLPIVFATLIAGPSSLFAQPATGEPAVADSPPAEPMTPPPPVAPALVATPPSAAPAVDPARIDTVTTGFAIEVRVGTAHNQIQNDTQPGVAAGIFLGHRSRVLTIGIGFDFSSLSQSMDATTGASAAQTTLTIVAIPGVRFVVARTTDAKTELLGQVDVGYGVTIRTYGNQDSPNVSRVRVQAGPSLRHWITSSFAIGGTAGIRYDRSDATIEFGPGGTGMTSTSSSSVAGLFSSVQMTGVF